MVCAYVQEDNPKALLSGLSAVHTYMIQPYNNFLIEPACMFNLFILFILM